MPTRIAALPMYPAAGAAANEAFWAAVSDRLRGAGVDDVPERLTQLPSARAGWADPRLLLGQSCGWPLVTEFAGALRPVAAPVYRAPGCSGATHRAFFIVRGDHAASDLGALRGARFAINSRDSNTGMNLPRHAVAPLAHGAPFFASVAELGSHAAAFEAVAAGSVDAAAIDCVSHTLLTRSRPELAARTRVVGETAPSPTLPFVSASATDEATAVALAAALGEVAATGAFRETLLLERVEPVDAGAYRVLLDYAEAARRLGYPELR